ncbi:DUF3784 domain-containing protein [Aquisalibacillus elongatus]|uniref:Uncharacterized protein DUF3784 n=1 Tax=Aquisalibacillus elongatus TaxID=485577 RepID=A0A3N5BLU3_9BACI|nr:DUF3784 domain-containing protein [Aquisalibacillus elongatus]RPF50658.1 uncharacterized protein DUF3784 [Aquisalibacillus elongatus]
MITGAITVIILVTLGIILLNGKATYLIAGYNLLSKSEREEIDKVRLAKFVGKIVLVMALAIGVLLVGDYYAQHILLWAGFGLIMLNMLWAIVVLVKKDWFRYE